MALYLPGLFSQQEGTGQAGNRSYTIPDALRRPERGEAPRYPLDVVIGTLGQGEAPIEAYLFARNFLAEMIAGNSGDNEEINELRPLSFRLGGGRTEADGDVSFLVRFLSNNESITGELYIRLEEENWVFDGLILEEKRAISEIRESARYEFSPYERFF